MNIEYGREFIELAQCLNFTEAAGSLNITQPALSKHMLALEREFGVELLDRSRKGVQLTEAGRILFESAGVMVSEYDKTKEALKQLKSTRPLRLVGHLEDSDVSTLVSMTAMLARENHQTSIVFDRSAEDPFELLASESVDLFIGYTNPQHIAEEGLSCVPFVSNPLIAFVAIDHPLATRTSITWDDLRAQTLMKFMSGKTNPAWEQIELTCMKHGFAPKTRPISAGSNVEFFSTPLHGDVLIWKKTQKQIGLLLETGRYASIPIADEDRQLVAYAVFQPSSEERLHGFFAAAEEARSLLDQRKDRTIGD